MSSERDEQRSRALAAHRAAWVNRGDARPAFADTPGPGQISVWDFPRPPRVEPEPRLVLVFEGEEREEEELARSTRALRVLETASPPTVYVPPDDVAMDRLATMPGESLCEWKGRAEYLCLASRPAAGAVAWRVPAPFEGYEALAGLISFYPGRVRCRLGEHEVVPQPGRFYGGWITPDLAGPFKGEPGTEGW